MVDSPFEQLDSFALVWRAMRSAMCLWSPVNRISTAIHRRSKGTGGIHNHDHRTNRFTRGEASRIMHGFGANFQVSFYAFPVKKNSLHGHALSLDNTGDQCWCFLCVQWLVPLWPEKLLSCVWILSSIASLFTLHQQQHTNVRSLGHQGHH